MLKFQELKVRLVYKTFNEKGDKLMFSIGTKSSPNNELLQTLVDPIAPCLQIKKL